MCQFDNGESKSYFSNYHECGDISKTGGKRMKRVLSPGNK